MINRIIPKIRVKRACYTNILFYTTNKNSVFLKLSQIEMFFFLACSHAAFDAGGAPCGHRIPDKLSLLSFKKLFIVNKSLGLSYEIKGRSGR